MATKTLFMSESVGREDFYIEKTQTCKHRKARRNWQMTRARETP